jgi:hypothetical protein
MTFAAFVPIHVKQVALPDNLTPSGWNLEISIRCFAEADRVNAEAVLVAGRRSGAIIDFDGSSVAATRTSARISELRKPHL